MRTKLLFVAIAVVVVVGVVGLIWRTTSGEPPIPPTGLPVAMDELNCSAGETGANIDWIRGTGFATPEAALGAALAGPHRGTFDPGSFAKRYVRLGRGETAGLGAEFTLLMATGDPSALAIATWSEDGWLVHGFTACLDQTSGTALLSGN